MTLPVALSGTDVIGQAKTGTGKTLGFGLPLLERVTVPADVEAGRAKPEALTDAPQALVVVPTRELCTQVTNDLLTAGKVRNVRVTAIYGGRAYEPQVEALKKGVDVVVGTPGRLLDLAGQKKLNLKHVKALVLDEADEMLDLGFLPDVEKIIGMLPARRQTMLFSATMPGAVIGLARRYMSQPTHIRATAPDDEGTTVANTTQFIYRAHNMDKPEMVARILQAESRGLAMVFCRTKRTAADLADQLKQRGFASGAVHGDLGQGAREQALRAFRNGKVDVLVCTDVAARGIDVEGVTHVINYQSPEEEKTYLHRIGRTGRAGAKGTAITLVDWDDIPRWQLINKALQLDFNDPPETYSTSPHLFTDLGIPEGTKGILPRSERTRAGLDAEELEDLGETGGRGARGARGGGRGERGDRGEHGSRGGRSEERTTDRERPARTPRRRRRTRGGATLDPSATPSGTQASGAPAEAASVEPAAADETTATRTPRRRRRTRNGASAQPVASAAPVTAEPQPAPAPARSPEAVVTAVEGQALDTPEAAEKPRRRRTRGKSAEPVVTPTEAAAPVVAQAPEAPQAPVAVPAEAEVAAPAPRRTRKKAVPAAEAAVATAEGTDAEPAAKPKRVRKAVAEVAPAETPAAAEAAVETAEATEAKPRRRTRKAAEAVESVETAATPETAESVEPVEAKPKRVRKTAAAKAAPVTDDAAAEVKPKRTRKAAATKATTTEAPAAAEAVVETAEAVEAKPKRVRKTAATKAATATDDTAAEAKPKRVRKTAAATKATTAEAAADAVATAEAAEAKPKRVRKTAAPKATTAESAEAAADTVATAEAAEAKPKRRTRKTAASTVAVMPEIPAQATGEPEAKPRRRTRKAAETADAAEATEAKPVVRRARKAAAVAESAEA
ncbi:DEAD/DEAH box helicase [Streptomyces sp. NPDC047017]|uniref:DEAD/DEAH box helicase n=1 Tax=Streptomyces sp. NPDC047017 TaxID=3155024 RepID=UPI003411CB58